MSLEKGSFFTRSLIIILVTGFSFFGNIHAGAISGRIQLDSAWEQRIFLSSITDFEDLTVASEQFLIAETELDSSGNFSFDALELPNENLVYRIHGILKGDPVSTIFIGGNHQNHIHFIYHPKTNAFIDYDQAGNYFVGLREKNLKVNQELEELYANIKEYHNKRSETSAQRASDLKVFESKLKKIADSSSYGVISLWAIHLLDIKNSYSIHRPWLLKFIEEEGSTSPYFAALKEQVLALEALNFPDGSNTGFLPWVLMFGIVLSLILGYFYFLGSSKDSNKKPDLGKLTVQERKVFEMIVSGKSNKEISHELHVELSTVKSHVNSIFSKLAVDSRATLIHRWLDN